MNKVSLSTTKTCHRKTSRGNVFRSRKQALRAALRLVFLWTKYGVYYDRGKVKPYQCPHCPAWHLGTVPSWAKE